MKFCSVEYLFKVKEVENGGREGGREVLWVIGFFLFNLVGLKVKV